MLARRSRLMIAALWIGLAAPAGVTRADLLAEGADERLWTAQVVVNADKNLPGRRTIVRIRGAGESERWRQVAEIAAPARSLTHRGGELVVLLANGDWRFVAESGIRSGDRLPGNEPVLAIAGDGEALWAVGLAVDQPPPVTSRVATQPSTAATVPLERPTPATTAATAAAVSRPRMLYRLDRGQWKAVALLPTQLLPAADAPLAMSIIDRRPLLASPMPDGAIRTVQLGEGNAWLDRGTLRPPLELHQFELLRHGGRATLWAAGATGGGVIYELERGTWTGPVELQTHAPLESGTDRALAAAFGRLRLLYAGGDQKLNEQTFGADGLPDGPPTEGQVQSPPPDPRISQFVQLGVMVLLMFVMLSTLRRRGSIQEAMRKADKLALAPLLPRFLAGMIDALPLIAVPAVLTLTSPTIDDAQLRMNQPVVQAWYGAAALFYLVYTAAAEMLFSRTLGKWIFGLRVANLDGSRATARALLLRNIMRLVDLTLVLFPLIMVFLSPLRQRIGDVAAGTLVVRSGVIIPPEPAPSASEDQ
ncbi:MAG TPA: RDD family protein [Tepidisphaeraceae bacterium]|nr:RDD family protein [Tepidisphaeraceae bacterium]